MFAPIVENMVESWLKWFGQVLRRPVEASVRRINQMESNPMVRGKGGPRKTIIETIKKGLDVNYLFIDTVHSVKRLGCCQCFCTMFVFLIKYLLA